MRRKSPETVKTPAPNYTKLVFCIIELDAWDRIFGATPAVNFSRKSAWDTRSAACVAAFGHRRLQQNAPCSLIKLPCDFDKLPCGYSELPRIVVALPCILPASVRHRLIDLAPAAVKFLLRPCHAVFEFFSPSAPNRRWSKPSDSRRFVVFLMTLCRRFDDTPIAARPASIMKTSIRKLNHRLKNTTAAAFIPASIGEKSSL